MNMILLGIGQSVIQTQCWGSSSNYHQSPVHQSSKMENRAPGTGPQYRSLKCLGRLSWTSSPLQVLNFRGLVWTAGTVLPVLPIPVQTDVILTNGFQYVKVHLVE